MVLENDQASLLMAALRNYQKKGDLPKHGCDAHAIDRLCEAINTEDDVVLNEEEQVTCRLALDAWDGDTLSPEVWNIATNEGAYEVPGIDSAYHLMVFMGFEA